MATMIEQRSSHPLGGYYEQEYQRFQSSPHFSNPWGAQSTPAQQLYNAHSQPTTDSYPSRPQFTSQPTSQLAPVESISQPRSYPTDFTTSAPTSAPSYSATSNERYAPESFPSSYSNYEARYASQYAARRPSYELKPTNSFNDALDGARGMVAMSQQDYTTPRAMYPARNNSTDSYGFPSNQSDHSSASSSSYPYYGSYTGSVDGSVAGSSATDYSSSAEEISQRTLPPPGQLINGFPPDASQMMNQFNSKLAHNTQKKHKCKICDKRFTRPSSLQTHMYSHTGEKPFACDFDGCGRHFSVVSNLRRHKKCHKGGELSDAGSTHSNAASEE